MKDIDSEIRHITPADGNIFLDLGFDHQDAERLLRDSQQRLNAESARHSHQHQQTTANNKENARQNLASA